MKKIIALMGVLLLILLLISCEEEGNGGDVTTYFPTTDGSLWNYDDILTMTSQNTGVTALGLNEMGVTSQSGDLSFKINGTASHNTQGTLYVVEVYMNSTYSHSLYMKANNSEVSWYYSLTADDHWELIKYPLTVGKTWSWTLYGSSMSAVVQAEESQTVPAGTFSNCMKIEYFADSSLTETIWFAPNVGIVRDYYSGAYDYQLQNYNIPT